MMKVSTKPISSPGRAEKFPPPLMRFLRSNVGSRSRGRSRSSPMFLRKKASTSAAAETQEPSSPKVTCMGQVRVRRSKKRTKTTGRTARTGAPTRRCKWIRNALFCSSCRGTFSSCSFRPDWRKWVPIFQSSFRRKVEINKDCQQIESKMEEESKQRVDEHDGDEEEAKVYVSNSSNGPPKNALLLTRCRSAPYRSSSLASRFWGSPLRSQETTEEEGSRAEQVNGDEPVAAGNHRPTSESESICRDSDQKPRNDLKAEENLGLFEADAASITDTTVKTELKTGVGVGGGSAAFSATAPGGGGGSLHPLLLTRCKSEPARTAGEKLDPEMNFWKLRRFGVADSCSHVL